MGASNGVAEVPSRTEEGRRPGPRAQAWGQGRRERVRTCRNGPPGRPGRASR